MIAHSRRLLDYYLQTDRGIGQFIRVEIWRDEDKIYELHDNAIGVNSLSIDRKSVSSSSFTVGEVYISEAKFTAINAVVDINQEITGCTVKIYTGVDFGSNFDEVQVFTGVIQPNSVTRRISGTEVSCDGVLCLFDSYIGNKTASGTAYDLVSWCCDSCGVECEQSKEDFADLSPNSIYTLFITNETSIRTYRDVLMYVAQVLCCFVYETPDGKISFESYSADAEEFDLNINTVSVSKYGDGRIMIDAMTWLYNGVEYYISGDERSLYVLELDENPLVSSISQDVWNVIGANMFEQVSKLFLRYAEIEYNGCPLVEVGDKLVVKEKDISCFVTSTKWTYHGKSSLNSVAIDKRINTEQQSVKSASRTGGSGGGGNDISVIRYINVDEVQIGEPWQQVCSTYFSTPAGVTPYIDLCCVLEFPSDGLLEARILYDSIEQLTTYKWSMHEGYFTLAFSKSFDGVDTARSHHIVIQFKFTGEENVTLEKYRLEMNIIAYKAITAEPEWTGLYEVKDWVPKFRVKGPIRMKTLNDKGPSVSTKIWGY